METQTPADNNSVANPIEVKGDANTINKNTYVLKHQAFSGSKAGFGFWYIQYLSFAFLLAKLNDEKPDPSTFVVTPNKKGEDVMLGLANAQIFAAIRNRATSRFGTPDTTEIKDAEGKVIDEKSTDAQKAAFLASIKDRLSKGDNILGTQQEAEDFIPGTREKSLATLMKEYSDAKKAKDFETALEIFTLIQAKMAEEQDAMLKA